MHEPRPARTRPERLRKRDDFSRVMRTGRRARHPLLHLVDLHTGASTTRVGLSVSKQVGGAVVRNLVKRRLRMMIQALSWQSGHDVVIVARSGIERVSFNELQRVLAQNAEKMRLLDAGNA